MNTLTTRQREMLTDFARDLEATDFDSYISHTRVPSHLAWRNRESVIEALHRKGLLDADGITDAGRRVLGETP